MLGTQRPELWNIGAESAHSGYLISFLSVPKYRETGRYFEVGEDENVAFGQHRIKTWPGMMLMAGSTSKVDLRIIEGSRARVDCIDL